MKTRISLNPAFILKNFQTKRIVFFLLLLPSFLSGQELQCLDVSDYSTLGNWQSFEEDLKSHSLILIGEGPHGMPANTYLQTELLIHLNKKYGTRFSLIELGSAEAYLINKYLKTGDKKYFDKTLNRNFAEAHEAIEKLYDYNKLIPDSLKIEFFGVDFERDPALTASVYYFLSGFNNPKLESLTETVKSRLDTIGFVMEPTSFLKYLKNELAKYAAILEQSGEWNQIEAIINNKSSYADFRLRDKRMLENFLRLKAGERFLGFFGTGHTQLDSKKAFANMVLNTEEFDKSDILTINIHHENSYFSPEYPIESAFLNDRGFFKKKSVKEHLSYFNSISDCETFLLKVASLKTEEFKALNEKGDYVLFIRNQNGYTVK